MYLRICLVSCLMVPSSGRMMKQPQLSLWVHSVLLSLMLYAPVLWDRIAPVSLQTPASFDITLCYPLGSRVPWILLACVGGNKRPGWKCLPQTQLECSTSKRKKKKTIFQTKKQCLNIKFVIFAFVCVFVCLFKDANWIALNSSLQCHGVSDIFLLFKSSDFITHDLTQPYASASRHRRKLFSHRTLDPP